MNQIKKTLCLLLTLVALMACIPASASAASVDIFDAEYYAAHNPDVVNALGRSESALRGHYNQYGKREGRAPSALFDPKFYVSVYPDLKAAFGTDYVAAYNHFLSNGIAEGRQGSKEFSVSIYKQNYADLRKAFGTSSSDNWKYLQHYLQYGKKEGRNAVSLVASSTSTSASTATSVAWVKTNGANLNMRKTASSSSSIVTKLANGTKVEVLGKQGTWTKVRVNGLTGYVSSQYLTTTAPSTTVTSTSKANTSMTNALYGINISGSKLTCGFDGYVTLRQTKGYRHEGIDFQYQRGQGGHTVYSLTDGVVTRVTEGLPGLGKGHLSTITIKYGDKSIVYLHTDPTVSEGQTVKRGDPIALESNRGADNYHSHVEVRSSIYNGAATSSDSVLVNSNPTSFWQSLGYSVK